MSYLLPEWSPVAAVVLVWPQPNGDWAANYPAVEQCYWQMLEVISEECAIWLLVHPEMELSRFEAKLGGFQSTQIKLINDIDYDDTWVRDFGPLSTSGGLLSFTFNGWGGKYEALSDNSVAASLAEKFGLPLHKSDFVCEGGALEINESQVLLVNAECVVDECRNKAFDRTAVETVLKTSLGAKEIAWLNGICVTGDDTDGHVDTIARFVPAGGVVYSGRNAAHHDATILENLHEQLNALACTHGWRLFELPTPILLSEVDGRLLPATYANFLIVNDVVFTPIYGCPEDSLALKVLAEAFQGFRIIPVMCAALAEQHGSLHCSTMQIASHIFESVENKS